jgi:Tfp pilus assembly protein PilO
MNMSWQLLKQVIIAALVVLLVADLGLLYVRWENSRENEAAMRAERDRLELTAKALKGDVARAQRIRESMSGVTKEYDAFYKTDFESTSDGYSKIEANLDAIAVKASVKSSGAAFEQKEVKGRGVEEIRISDTVEGDYSSIIKFISGLEQSPYFYLLSELKLDSDLSAVQGSASPGALIRLHLELRTYFKS